MVDSYECFRTNGIDPCPLRTKGTVEIRPLYHDFMLTELNPLNGIIEARRRHARRRGESHKHEWPHFQSDDTQFNSSARKSQAD